MVLPYLLEVSRVQKTNIEGTKKSEQINISDYEFFFKFCHVL